MEKALRGEVDVKHPHTKKKAGEEKAGDRRRAQKGLFKSERQE